MGNIRGFLKHQRAKIPKRPLAERVRDYRWVYEPMPEKELREQASRCMDCGVPFCNVGCPVNNLIPDWNHLVYKDRWREAIDRLHATNNFPEFTGRFIVSRLQVMESSRYPTIPLLNCVSPTRVVLPLIDPVGMRRAE